MNHSDARDKVLIWGSQARINFETKRASATRFVYFGPLRVGRRESKAKRREMLDRLLEQPPRFMVDMADSSQRVLEFPDAEPEIVRAGQQLLSQYEIRETNAKWTVYELRSPKSQGSE